MDMRLSKFFRIGEVVRIEGIFEVFNLFNNENPAGFRSQGGEINGNINDPGFGLANTFAGDPFQGDQRLAQLGFRIEF